MADAVPTKHFVRTALTGGTTGCMDAIDGARLEEGYTCEVTLSTFVTYKYRLNATSGAAESSPEIITPDTNAGNKRWLLCYSFQDSTLARLPDQAVNMTAAASGSSGIVVADNDNIDFGTGNFTLVWRGSLPDWSTPTYSYLMYKVDATSGFYIAIMSTGIIRLCLARNSSVVNFSSTVPISFGVGTTHEITIVVVRETASVAGSITFYGDGVQVGDVIAISTATVYTLSNAQMLYLLGDNSSRTVGICSFLACYNRALTAATEVLDLYRNGIAFADKWGSQTELITNGTMEADANWASSSTPETNERSTIQKYSGTYSRHIVDSTGSNGGIVSDAFTPFVVGKKYRLAYAYYIVSGSIACVTEFSSYPQTIQSVVGSWQIVTSEFTAIAADTTVYFYNSSAVVAAEFYIDAVSIVQIGATLALESEGIQNSKWYDSSSNALHASYPAAGWSLTRNINVPRTNTAQPAFLARPASKQENIAVGATTIIFGTVIINQGSCFSSNTYTALVSGSHLLSVNIFIENVDTAASYYLVEIITSNRTYTSAIDPGVYSRDVYYLEISINVLADMDVGDTAYCRITQSAGTQQTDIGTDSTFSGFLAC